MTRLYICSSTIIKSLLLILILFMLAGCNQDGSPVPPTASSAGHNANVPQPTATFTPTTRPTDTPTPRPSPTFTITPSPTPTQTPTPTAVPITIIGNPRPAPITNPVPQNNAPCGLVDTLDFPIDPPDALTVSRGGQDFGSYRQRYEKYHAGEDWGGPAGRENFGTPVYSIGHGWVTYAEPEGWNRDKGVVIVQHTFADGRSFYSFYGHLDPPSVTLQAGDCVVRGEQVGQIGRPRSSPHLHFEIRTHMPYNPGPGYWPEDPTTVGWLPPSQTIWQERMAASPGVQWTRPSAATGTQAVGAVLTQTVVLLEEGQLVGVNVDNGRVRWRFFLTDEQRITAALVAEDGSAIYLTNQFGELSALPIPQPDAAPSPGALWKNDLGITGVPTLWSLPGGGVAVLAQQQIIGFSPTGEELWRTPFPARPSAWATSPDLLAITTPDDSRGLWTINSTGPTAWNVPGGQPVAVGNQVWVYGVDGIYRQNGDTTTLEPVLALPSGTFAFGDAIALPDRGVLIAHTDRQDRRLIALNGDGSVRWDRSFAALGMGEVELLASDGRVYLITQAPLSANNDVTVYAVDAASAELTRLFNGGSRLEQPHDIWAFTPTENLLLIHVGGSLIALNPQLANSEQ